MDTDKQELYEFLDIKDGRNIGTQQALQMFSKLKSNDKDLAFRLKCVEIIPNLADVMKATVSSCIGEVDKIMSINEKENDIVMSEHRKFLSYLYDELDNNSDMSTEERLTIITKISDENDKIDELHRNNQKSRENMTDKVLKFAGSVTVSLLTIIGGIVGLKALKTTSMKSTTDEEDDEYD